MEAGQLLLTQTDAQYLSAMLATAARRYLECCEVPPANQDSIVDRAQVETFEALRVLRCSTSQGNWCRSATDNWTSLHFGAADIGDKVTYEALAEEVQQVSDKVVHLREDAFELVTDAITRAKVQMRAELDRVVSETAASSSIQRTAQEGGACVSESVSAGSGWRRELNELLERLPVVRSQVTSTVQRLQRVTGAIKAEQLNAPQETLARIVQGTATADAISQETAEEYVKAFVGSSQTAAQATRENLASLFSH